MSCFDLLGMPYRLGADGSDGEIDCIHLVYKALEDMGIEPPPFDSGWYESDWRPIARVILKWGNRIERPQYDVDVVIDPTTKHAFGVVWQGGLLAIGDLSHRVQWFPLSVFNPGPGVYCLTKLT